MEKTILPTFSACNNINTYIYSLHPLISLPYKYTLYITRFSIGCLASLGLFTYMIAKGLYTGKSFASICIQDLWISSNSCTNDLQKSTEQSVLEHAGEDIFILDDKDGTKIECLTIEHKLNNRVSDTWLLYISGLRGSIQTDYKYLQN